MDPNVSDYRGSYVSAWYGFGNETWYLRPAEIMYFFRHQVDVLSSEDDNGDDSEKVFELSNVTHTFAYVRYALSNN